MRFHDDEHEGRDEKPGKFTKKEKNDSRAHWISASDISREDFDKGRNRRRERSARLKKFRGFFLRHGMLLRENIRR